MNRLPEHPHPTTERLSPMIPSAKILDLVSSEPSRGLGGTLAYLSGAGRTRMNGDPHPQSQMKLLADMADQCAATSPVPAQYSHPANDPRARAAKPSGGLTPSDLAWINRLPADPAQVSHQDAVSLAGLATGLSPMSNASDHRLVSSVWLPIKEIHDANSAKMALQNAQTTTPPVPSSAIAALADAIAAETPNLQPAEALSRARTQLDEALSKRNANRDGKVLDARAAIARASEAASQRTAVTRS